MLVAGHDGSVFDDDYFGPTVIPESQRRPEPGWPGSGFMEWLRWRRMIEVITCQSTYEVPAEDGVYGWRCLLTAGHGDLHLSYGLAWRGAARRVFAPGL